MSDTNTAAVTTTQPQQPANRQEIEKAKADAWGKMGVVIYRKELDFQIQAQVALSKLEVYPATVADIPKAELLLKDVKAEQAKLIEARKAITARFDDVADRLMKAEKSFADPLAKFAAAIISLKKKQQEDVAKIQLKIAELKRVREQVTAALHATDARHKKRIADMIQVAYSHALGAGDIKPENLVAFLKVVNFKHGALDHYPCTPPETHAQHATGGEIEAIIMDVWNITAVKYKELFEAELFKRFSDYDAAYLNKRQALALAEKETADSHTQIAEEQEIQHAAAALESHSAPVNIEPADFKPLRKSYEVDMEETFENAMTIMAAFVANKNLCKSKTTTKKWFAFTADSAAKALAKVKSDDNAFSPSGITFKEVDKL